jgi:excisionase family DNA binding protein
MGETSSKPLAVSLVKAATLLGVSKDTLRRAAARKDLKVIRICSRVMIPRTELDRILEHGLNGSRRKGTLKLAGAVCR